MIPYHPHHHGFEGTFGYQQYHHHHDYHHHHQQQHQMAAAAAAAAVAAEHLHFHPGGAVAASASASASSEASPALSGRLFFRLPRVVPDQRRRFEAEDVFKRNSRDMEVRFTLFRDRPLHERQTKFLQGCRDGHVEVSHTSTGLVLILTWNPLHQGGGGGYAAATAATASKLNCDFGREPGKVHLCCPLIVNGVCVRWRGWLDLERLDGVGRVDFDHDAAKVEDSLLQQQIHLHRDRIKEVDSQKDKVDNNNKEMAPKGNVQEASFS